MAGLLYQLQQAGQTIPESWILSAEYFQQSLQRLITREPAFADWPQLLWQTPHESGYARQQLAKRLRRTLLGLPLNLSCQSLLEAIKTPVVRLLPSLWFGEEFSSVDFVQMVDAPICWAEPTAVEIAIKQIWAEMMSARSLAYWEHWQRKIDQQFRSFPKDIGVSIIIQAVEPLGFSGTMTIRPDSITIQAVQGLPKAISESCPDSYQGNLLRNLSHKTRFTWQQGYQEQHYQPVDASSASSHLEDCLSKTATPMTALEIISSEAEIALLEMAQQLQNWTASPLHVEWSLSESCPTSPQILQATWWPFAPKFSPLLKTSPAPASSRKRSGHPASPGQVIGVALVLKPGDPLPASANQQIVVASEVAAHWLPLLKTAAAVISEKGGLTCHAAILARELRLPAVIGIADATNYFRTGEVLRLDGDKGFVTTLNTHHKAPTASSSPPQIPGVTHKTEIWLNLSQPDLAADMASLPVAGIGLLRSEWLMMPVLDHRHPYQWLIDGQREVLLERLATQLRSIVKAFAPRPVRYRSLDIRSHEFAQLQGAPPVESNPMLGVRGTFSYQQYPDFFRLELEVLKQLQIEGYTNLHLTLPFVRTVAEVEYCQQLIQEVGVNQAPPFELWMMAEVPSVLFLMAHYVAAGIQGIAIGSSDLTQLLLGIDRDQALFSTYFDVRHSVVQAAIFQLIQQAQALEVPCILCGVAAAHYPDFVASLIRQGITGISVDAAAVETTAQAILQAEASLH